MALKHFLILCLIPVILSAVVQPYKIRNARNTNDLTMDEQDDTDVSDVSDVNDNCSNVTKIYELGTLNMSDVIRLRGDLSNREKIFIHLTGGADWKIVFEITTKIHEMMITLESPEKTFPEEINQYAYIVKGNFVEVYDKFIITINVSHKPELYPETDRIHGPVLSIDYLIKAKKGGKDLKSPTSYVIFEDKQQLVANFRLATVNIEEIEVLAGKNFDAPIIHPRTEYPSDHKPDNRKC